MEMCAPHWSRNNVCRTPTPSADAATGRRDAVKRGRSREAKKWVWQIGGDECEAAGEEVQGEREERGAREERGWTASRSSFYKPRAKGGVTTRCDAPSSESCPSIGSRPRPARLLGREAASFTHLARHGPELCTDLPGRVLATGRGSCRSCMPVQGTPGELRLVLLR